MINPLVPNNRPKMPEMSFSFYTPFMEGRSVIEALLEIPPEDYFENEITLERRYTFKFEEMKDHGRFMFADKMSQKFYAFLKEIYDEIENKKPDGKLTFYIWHNWECMYNTLQDGLELLVWMRGAWVNSSFLDEPIYSFAKNHIPKNMMKGY